jgi:phage tail-like protein
MRSREIEQLLPWVFRRAAGEGGVLQALLAAMESLHAPDEAALAALDSLFDPRRTPARFVPFLARWVDLDWLFEAPATGRARVGAPGLPSGVGAARLRELVAAAAYLSQWRGSARGLLLFLEIATGLRGFALDEDVLDTEGRPRPFHVRLRGPAAAAAQRALIARIVEFEKPAHVTYELSFEAPAVDAEAAPAVPPSPAASPTPSRRRRSPNPEGSR